MLNAIPTEVNNYKEVANVFERLAAKLEKIDIAKFREETARYQNISEKIARSGTEAEINDLLLSAYKVFDIRIAWTGDFDSFMGNRNNKLVFD